MIEVATEKESKHNRFVLIATSRTNKVLNEMRKLKKCSREGYEYSEEEAGKILTAIEAEVEDLRRAFMERRKKPQPFTLLDLIESKTAGEDSAE